MKKVVDEVGSGNIDKLPGDSQESASHERTVKGKRPIIGGRPATEEDAELAVLDKIKLALLIKNRDKPLPSGRGRIARPA